MNQEELAAWAPLLQAEFQTPDWAHLSGAVDAAYAAETVYPPRPALFRALRLTPPTAVRAVILGQDPYHTPGMADGLAFSVPEGTRPPPSLRNICRELQDDLGLKAGPACSSLAGWASQGVLLLNTVLTVRAHQANSHRGIGWEEFTDAAIRVLAEQDRPMVFILWGRPAQTKKSMLHNPKHLILEAPHPSPLSAYRGFFGSRPFSQTNEFLEKNGLAPIDWQIENI